MEINEEVYQYYSKLLAMKGKAPAGQNADAREGREEEEEENDPENRYRIIVPDAVHKFPVSAWFLLKKGNAGKKVRNADLDMTHFWFVSVEHSRAYTAGVR